MLTRILLSAILIFSSQAEELMRPFLMRAEYMARQQARIPGPGGTATASGATFTVIDHKIADSATSGTTIAVTVASSTIGDSICVGMGSLGNTITVTGVADNASGGTNTYSQVSSARATNVTPPDLNTDAWCSLNTPRGTVTSVTVTFSGSITYRVAEVWQVRKSGGSAALDVAGATNNGVAVTGTASGPSITTTGTVGFVGAFILPNGTITANPKVGNAFTSGGDIAVNGPAGASLITSGAGATQAQWTDSVSADTFCASGFSLK